MPSPCRKPFARFSNSVPFLIAWMAALLAMVGAAQALPIHATAATARNQPPQKSKVEFAEDAVLIAFNTGTAMPIRSQVLSSSGLTIDSAHSNAFFVRAKIAPTTSASGAEGINALIARLKRDKAIRVVEPDFTVHAASLPNDPLFPQQWSLNQSNDADIDLPEAWTLTQGSPNVTVAVVDSGVDYNHPDLTDNILRSNGQVVGYDFYDNSPDPMDFQGHGTHCAGIIGAVSNNGIGIVGISPIVRIMPVKFLKPDGSGNISAAVQAIDFAREHGAQIINCSWSTNGNSELLKEAIQRTRDANILFVAAAGDYQEINGGLVDTGNYYPARYNSELDNIISVGASDENDTKTPLSHYGAGPVDIFAPGNHIISTIPGGYDYRSGTSMAAAHVSGVAALIEARYSGIPYLTIKDRILFNVDTPVALKGLSSSGRLNAPNTLFRDTIPPGPPTDFVITHYATTAFAVQWVTSGDDREVGTASRYDIRYSTEPITKANFDSLPPGKVITPLPSGKLQSTLITGLMPDTAYYVGIRAVDNVGNVSPVVTTAHQKTVSPTVYLNDTVSGTPLWTSSGASPWHITSDHFVSPSTAWAHGPSNSGEADSYLTLTTPLNLSTATGDARLSFQAHTQLGDIPQEGYPDLYLTVEASEDGITWTRLGLVVSEEDWKAYTYPLTGFLGKSRVYLRFHINGNDFNSSDDAWIDDIKVTGLKDIFYTVVLQDDAEENTPRKFTGWPITTAEAFQGFRSYEENSKDRDIEYEFYLTQSADVKLTNFIPQLEYWVNYELDYADSVSVEISTDGGATWQSRNTYPGYINGNGSSLGWLYASIPLEEWYGKNFRVRYHYFAFKNFLGGHFDGAHLDNITIGGPKLVKVPKPVAPTGLLASATNSTTITLSWNESLGADGYKLYRKLSTDAAFTLLSTLPRTAQTFTDATALPEKTYSYEVTATNFGGESHIPSLPANVTTMNPPTNLMAADGGGPGKVKLTWVDNTASETKYSVEYKQVTSTTWSGAINLPAGTTTRLLTGLASGVTYQFHVRAGNDSGRSSYSDPVTFTVP